MNEAVEDEDEQERKIQEAYKGDDEYVATMMFTNFLIWLRSERTDIDLTNQTDSQLHSVAKQYVTWASNATDAALSHILQNGE